MKADLFCTCIPDPKNAEAMGAVCLSCLLARRHADRTATWEIVFRADDGDNHAGWLVLLSGIGSEEEALSGIDEFYDAVEALDHDSKAYPVFITRFCRLRFAVRGVKGNAVVYPPIESE